MSFTYITEQKFFHTIKNALVSLFSWNNNVGRSKAYVLLTFSAILFIKLLSYQQQLSNTSYNNIFPARLLDHFVNTRCCTIAIYFHFCFQINLFHLNNESFEFYTYIMITVLIWHIFNKLCSYLPDSLNQPSQKWNDSFTYAVFCLSIPYSNLALYVQWVFPTYFHLHQNFRKFRKHICFYLPNLLPAEEENIQQVAFSFDNLIIGNRSEKASLLSCFLIV